MTVGPFGVLSQEQVVRLHEGALKLLATTGMLIHSRAARVVLADRGAIVNQQSEVVRFPERLVYELAGRAPTSYILGGRDSEHDLTLTLSSALTRPIAGCNKVFDLRTNRRRDPTTQDMIEAALIVDGLPRYDCNAAFVYGIEEPPPTRAVHYFKILLEHTRKHICMSPYGPRDVEYMIEMAGVIQGSREEIGRRPIFNIITSPASPLVFSDHFANAIMTAGKAGIPVMMGSTPIAGGTGPVTLAGSIVLMHAENLVGVLIAQAANPGAPIYVGPRPTAMDMRVGTSLWGPIEWGLASSGAVQVASWCGLPTDFMGVGTDSKLPDQQAGIERAMMAVLAFLVGPSLIAGGGYIDTISTGSLEQLVIDDEIFGMARRLVQGVEVDTERMALDVIDQVGPGGNFLAEEHTRKYHRLEHLIVDLADRNTYGKWEEEGLDVVRRSRSKADGILSSHEVPPLEDASRAELHRILDTARRTL